MTWSLCAYAYAFLCAQVLRYMVEKNTNMFDKLSSERLFTRSTELKPRVTSRTTVQPLCDCVAISWIPRRVRRRNYFAQQNSYSNVSHLQPPGLEAAL